MTVLFNAQDIREITRINEDIFYKTIIEHITEQAQKSKHKTSIQPSAYNFETYEEIQNLVHFLETRGFIVKQDYNETLTIQW